MKKGNLNDKTYLYCAINKNIKQDFGGIGIDGNEVYPIPYKSISVIAQDCSAELYNKMRFWKKKEVMSLSAEHDNVVNIAVKRFGSVFPFNVGTVIKGGEDAVRKWLSNGYTELKEELEIAEKDKENKEEKKIDEGTMIEDKTRGTLFSPDMGSYDMGIRAVIGAGFRPGKLKIKRYGSSFNREIKGKRQRKTDLELMHAQIKKERLDDEGFGVIDKGNHVLVFTELQMPDVNEEDINVNVMNNVLTIIINSYANKIEKIIGIPKNYSVDKIKKISFRNKKLEILLCKTKTI